jgi:hypothetical protein
MSVRFGQEYATEAQKEWQVIKTSLDSLEQLLKASGAPYIDD